MRDEAITVLDPVVDEVEKMAQLCATVGEAAGHAAAHPGSAPEMRALIRAGADHHSLVYRRDAGLKRRLRIWKNHLGNIKRFRQYNRVPED